jgi:hypothetical protein
MLAEATSFTRVLLPPRKKCLTPVLGHYSQLALLKKRAVA